MPIFNGTNNISDTIVGSAGADTIYGYDSLSGSFGGVNDGDSLSGGLGGDSIYGGDGNDTIDGGGGSDNINAGDGNDYVTTGIGTFINVSGGNGDDTIIAAAGSTDVNVDGGAGSDLIDLSALAGNGFFRTSSMTGGDGNDTILGSGGIDFIDGGAGANVIHAGDGNDVVTSTGGPDVLDGGTGIDKLILDRSGSAGAVNLNFSDPGVVQTLADGSTVINFERVNFTSGSGNDTIVASNTTEIDNTSGLHDNFIHGGGGNDSLTGGSNGASLFGDAGNDTLTAGGSIFNNLDGGDGNDLINFGSGGGTFNGGNGDDTIIGGLNGASGAGGAGNDYIDLSARTIFNVQHTGAAVNGGDGSDTIIGTSGNDQIDGWVGNDSVNAGAGNDSVTSQDIYGSTDTLDGGAGDDSLAISRIGATVGYNADFSNPAALVTLVDGTTLINFETVNFAGGNGNDTITSSNHLVNNIGNTLNFVSGGGGNDYLVAAPNGAQMNGQEDNDTLMGGVGNDYLLGGAGNDYIVGSAGIDSIDGGTGSDTFVASGALDGSDIYYGTGFNVTAFPGDADTLDYSALGAANSISVTLNGATLATVTIVGGNDDKVAQVQNIIGGAGDDVITGDAKNNVFKGGGGNDILDGGDGTDTAVFSGNRANYTVTVNADGTTTVADISAGAPDGTDTLKSIETLVFADTLPPPPPPVSPPPPPVSPPPPPVSPPPVSPPPPPVAANFTTTNTTTGITTSAAGEAYTGPVAGLKFQFVYTGADNINVTSGAANEFIHTGSGFDAIDVSVLGGSNVLDGGTNSNFLVGGTSTADSDTFFVDDRSPPADIWSTVVNFHAGDAATIFGITPNGFTTSWVDNQGAAGFTGLTLHVTAPGVPIASITLAGYATADLTNGRLTQIFGSEADGTPYLYIHGDS